jgi:trk system potassium uptake protein TrkH
LSPDSTRRSTPSPTASSPPGKRVVIFAPPAPGPGSRANARRHSQLFLLALGIITLIGTLLLALPWVTRSGQRTAIIDALFTAVSASTVTGLSVVDTFEHWNVGGQFVVLLLVQTGGLGFMVGASILLQMLRRGASSYSLRDEMLLKDGSPALSIQEAVALARAITRFTFVVEGIGAGAIALWFATAGQLAAHEALWNGVFYAVAAFCNAGFDLTGPSAESIRPMVSDVWFNLILMVLIQLGALSYMVVADAAGKRRWHDLSLDAKIVLGLNGVLLAAGAFVFLAAEWGGALAAYAPGDKVLASLFQSVSARSAGFSTIDWSLANPLTLFFWLALMFVGGASGSTSGGVRLSTAGVVLAAVASTLRGNPETEIGHRRVATPIVFRAVTVIVIFIVVYIAGTVALATTEHHIAHIDVLMLDLMFEAMSALATTGVSTGITALLTVPGKLILCVLMFVGHLGPLVTVYALQRRQSREHYRFPEEAVRIG